MKFLIPLILLLSAFGAIAAEAPQVVFEVPDSSDSIRVYAFAYGEQQFLVTSKGGIVLVPGGIVPKKKPAPLSPEKKVEVDRDYFLPVAAMLKTEGASRHLSISPTLQTIDIDGRKETALIVLERRGEDPSRMPLIVFRRDNALVGALPKGPEGAEYVSTGIIAESDEGAGLKQLMRTVIYKAMRREQGLPDLGESFAR